MANAYPLTEDVEAILGAAGITVPAQMNTDSALAAAIAWWEQATGYFPFLGASQTRTYDPPGMTGSELASPRGGYRVLSLDCGLVSLSSLTIAGATYTVDSQFWLRPNNAPRRGRPYEWIEFLAPVLGSPKTISITGVFGFGTTIPDDAFEAVLRKAAALCLQTIREKLSAGVIEWKQADREQRRGELVVRELGTSWEREAAQVAARYKRITVGL